ncbi:uncharacterized protein EI90DRAFT_2932185 [Cantharellus anzutake]|uniref:uncharacterized protein n=1 Tax=Cantharellus anzutake TaxID=1750568 RepID=UPI0019073D8C|nr:uncharacterized protein EI90DRAFT_2932185 [Cantharellus anzutake]KAF8325384.1 hypothetical protein EI90DRAFT_2932185 [Cantharellus anzutake]
MPLLQNLALCPEGIHSDSQFLICRVCHLGLRRQCILSTAIANDLYFGPVPSCLSDLTLIEEALIARRRAKSWIIHLRDDSSGNSHATGAAFSSANPTSQRALKGHIIIFPAKPEALAPFLPPPLGEVLTAMCVVFVGFSKPSKEWLLNNARPLLVRHEKVCLALEWLIANNPLYEGVILHNESLIEIPLHDIASVPIEQHESSVAGDAQGARYDDLMPTDSTLNGFALHSESLLQGVLVTDIDLHGSNSAEMAAAAIRHLKRPNGEIGAHIQVGHSADPVNHYSDPLSGHTP